MYSLRLGVLDSWSDVGPTVALAEEVDRLGYARYWLTEHPPQPNPQLLAALVAGVTEQISVGTAGLLLQFHNPLQAAQQFLLLERVYPGRIDAGFCAGGAGELVAQALLDSRPDLRRDPVAYDERARTLIGFLRGKFPDGHPYQEINPWPLAAATPEIWSFGTGPRSAHLAAEQGVAYGYSLFHSMSRDDTAAVETYRQEFRPTLGRPEPLVSLSVAGVCAETSLRAAEFSAAHVNPFIVPTIIGTPDECRDQLVALAERYGTRELMFLDCCPDQESRLRSYQLLAEACGLTPLDAIASPETEWACTD